MYKCPKCHNIMDGNEIKCKTCEFKLKITLEEFEQRELETYNIDEIKFEEKSKNIKNLNIFLNGNDYGNLIADFRIPKEEFDVLVYKLISYIYLDYFIPREDFEDNIKDLLNSYFDEYKDNFQSLISNLNHLKMLLGFPNFSEFYEELLLENSLSLNKGMEIYGFLISDILENNLQRKDFDSKLNEYISEYKSNNNFHMTRKDKEIHEKLVEYYRITGKKYFSKRFDNLLDKYNLSVDQAFNVKRKLLIDIYSGDEIYLKKNFELYVHHEIKTKDKPLIYRRLGAGTREDRVDWEDIEILPYRNR